MKENLLKMGAAARLGMPVSTFCVSYESLGLMPVLLPFLKQNKRWLESEIDAFIEARKQERDRKLAEDERRQREISKLVRQK